MILAGISELFSHHRSVLLGLVALFASAAAQASEPIYVKNLNPVRGLLGIPSQRAAFIPSAGNFDLALHGSLANTYLLDVDASEALNLDGETLRFALEGRYALADNWDLQLEVPWLQHSGGQLDSVIDGWHDFWSMPDGGRPEVKRDLLDYRYGNGDHSFALLDDASGLGDITLSTSYVFYNDGGTSSAVVAGYKFATGDDDKFLGSGGDDAYLALRFSGRHLADLPLTWHGQLGYLRAGSSELMGTRQERDLWFAGLSLDWAAFNQVSVIGQVDIQAAPMNSEITGMGDEAVMLSLGMSWRFLPHWSADFNFVEDAAPETAPDIILQASIRYRSSD
ncbi:MAG: DUF3187 family protein [Halioglobus sp.]